MAIIKLRGDGKVFENLVDTYSDAVYKFCRSLTYTKEDAEDLFQETFIKAHGQLHKMADSPQGYLFSIAIYLWKSHKRKYARRMRIANMVPLDDVYKSDFDVWDKFSTQEEVRIVRKLVADLPTKFRLPVVLFYTVEFDVAEIAAILRIPPGTVKSRLHKARSIIKKGLAEHGYQN